MVKGIIFDMDGTILDTMYLWRDSGLETLNEMVLPRYPDLFKNDVPFNHVIETLIEGIKDKKFLEEVLREWYLHKMRNNYKTCTFKEGAKEFLEHCKDNGIKMCLATATPECMAMEVVKRLHLDDYFMSIKTVDMGFRNKHHSDIYDACLKDMNLNKDEVLVFEDTINPIITLKDANYRVVGVEDEVSEIHRELIKEKADYYIPTYKNLKITNF